MATINPLQRPHPRKVQASTPKKQSNILPELTLDIASREQEHKRLRGNVDLSSQLEVLNASIRAALEARDAFLEANGYIYETHGSYGDTEYYAIHPLYLCQWLNEGPSMCQDVPEWAVINLS